ncbi:MAG: hypothetical protein IMZ50_08490, partial [Candidatus Atribacteria bacterium]|nr:hypothetical protein [Candidatus Atribacteria bacterium]
MATLLHRIQKGIYGDNQWYARQTWKLDNSSAEGFAAGRLGLELTTATTSSLYDPLCTKVDIVKNARVKGKALVTETFTAVRKPGTATIVGSIKTASYRKADVDRDGLVISGPVGDGLNLWRPSPAGSNVVGNTSEGIIVKACYAAQDVATWRSWQNKVNSSTMATLGAAPGILLLRGVNYHPIYMG